MKTIFILSATLLLFLSGCASYPTYESFDTYIDFDKYSQSDFFISINDYNGKFAPKGLLSVSCYSGELKVEVAQSKNMFNDDIYYSSASKYKKEFKACDINELLSEIVDNARSKGADTFCPIGPWIDTEFDSSKAKIEAYQNEKLTWRSKGRCWAKKTPISQIVNNCKF